MKQIVIMKRPMGQFQVEQRTSDSMFNATALLEQWNNANPLEKRHIDNFWKSSHLRELMSEIAENELNFKCVDFTELKNALTDIRKGRHNGGTWMHPYLFIKFAMYLSPKFEYSVIKFVYDELIKNRHLAGDKYRCLTASASIFPNVEYYKLAICLNYIIFNNHYKDIRNTATYEQLDELHKLEEQLSFSIDNGFITSYQQLLIFMRKLWTDKWCKIG